MKIKEFVFANNSVAHATAGIDITGNKNDIVEVNELEVADDIANELVHALAGQRLPERAKAIVIGDRKYDIIDRTKKL